MAAFRLLPLFVILPLVLFVQLVVAASPPYGQLSVKGTQLVGSGGQAVALHGMSLFWSQWSEGSGFYNKETVQALKCQWNANLVRATMGVDQGGYLSNPSTEQAKIEAVVQAAIDLGIYVIIDWHVSATYTSQAVSFFSAMSKKYGSNPNIIYETYNEPLGVSWTGELVPYHKAVIAAIRANDANNVIVCGTPNWSQDVDVASQNPITGYTNIIYTLHYYAASHKESLRAKAQTALNNGIGIFVTEYGTVDASGGGSVDQASSEAWWTFLDTNKISYANWAIDNKAEAAAALNPGTTSSQVGSDSVLTASGKLVKAKLLSQSNGVSCSGSSSGSATTTTAKPSGSGTTTTVRSAATTTTKAASSGGGGSSVSGVSASISTVSTWGSGGQFSVVFKNSGSSAVCSVVFKLTPASGQTVNSIWNVSGPSGGQYTTSNVNIAAGATNSNVGLVVSGSASAPSVSVVSAKAC